MIKCEQCQTIIQDKKSVIVYSSILGIFHNECFSEYVYLNFNCSQGLMKDIEDGLW